MTFCAPSLEARLGWEFGEPHLLSNALTHTTYVNENPGAESEFDRFRFLGGAVLNVLVANLLFERFSEATEEELCRRRAQVMHRRNLAVLANRLNLGSYIRLGVGQNRSGGPANERILADTFESLTGAVYLDGAYQAVERCLTPFILSAIEQARVLSPF